MTHLPFLTDLVIILFAALIIIVVSRPFRVPSIVGFLLTGILLGPAGMNIIAETTIIESFAEVGIVLLLFVVGLEFSLQHLRAMWRNFFVAGGLQVILTSGLVFLMAGFWEFSTGQRVFMGFLVALSSTAIVLKLLSDRSEIDTPHGKLILGVLLFQDFCIVPMIVLVPLLTGAGEISTGTIVTRLGLSVIGLGVIFLVARSLLAKVFDQIVRTRIREAFLLGSLFICLLFSAITAAVGFSYAIGAFLAGLLVSETHYNLEVGAEISSFRDLFTSLFFISIGMLLDREFVQQNILTILLFGGGIIATKALMTLLAATIVRSSSRTAAISSLTLAQVGEFSFVLVQVGASAGLISESFQQHFLGASIFSMLLSPLLIGFAPAVADRTHHFLPLRKIADSRNREATLQDHVVIVGFGVNGQNLVRVLTETGIPHVVVESDAEAFVRLRREKSPAVFGDITRKEILDRCSIKQARAIVYTISDPLATRTSVRQARIANPTLHIIVRTRLVAEVDDLTKAGADEVIPEEFETSIEIFTRVLDHYHIPRNVINAQIQIIRDENYRILRGIPQTTTGLDRIARYLTAGTSDIFLVTDDSFPAGKTLDILDISGMTGTTLIAVVRNEKPFMTPQPDFRIEAGDVLILVGNHANMDKAFEYLSKSAVAKG